LRRTRQTADRFLPDAIPFSSGVLPDQQKFTLPALPTDISLLHQTQTKRKMKATTIILAAVLSFSMNVLFAGNDGAVVNREMNVVYTSLAPSTPTEATFEEISDATVTIIILEPVTPVEADFTEAI
jgi:hypothetical protein